MTLAPIFERRRHTGDDNPAPSTAFPPQIAARRPTAGDAGVLLGERRRHGSATAIATATLATTVATEVIVRTGGGTIALSVFDDTFVAAGATFDAQRQAIINGLNGSLATDTAWDDAVVPALTVGTVVRTSATLVTITLPAVGAYALPAGISETVTVTIPASALEGGVALLAGNFRIAPSVVRVYSPPRVYVRVNGRTLQLRGAV